MRFKKIYGQSRIESCPFCKERAIAMNSQGIPVCVKHKKNKLPEIKCACGKWLELRKGKWGAYFNCINCGNINFGKAMEQRNKLPEKENIHAHSEANSTVNTESNSHAKTRTGKQTQTKPAYRPVKETRKEMTITSDELDFYY